MSPDLMFWLALAVKMAVTAASVVTASIVAERSGSFVGGLVAALPISAGPAYVFLSLDHDAEFIAASALASLAVNVGTTAYTLIYILLAQGRGIAASLSASLAAWLAITALMQSTEWTLATVLAINIAAYLIALPISRRFQSARIRPAVRHWYDLPLRAGMVAALVATVVISSRYVGPALTGTLAVFPVVLSSLVVIFQPRIGGTATAALLANTMPGLIGFASALTVLHVSTVPFGTAAALVLGLATSVGWNLALWIAWRRAAPVRSPSSPP
jgi:hypothetical protein